MNNQLAVLSFAQNYVYFEVKPTLQNQFATTGSNLSSPQTPIVVSSTMKTVPVGVILSLQTVADPRTNEITMNIRPSISSIVDYKQDPAAAFLIASLLSSNSNASSTLIQNKIPVIEKKELDSVLKVKSGEVAVLGGYISEQADNTKTGIPFLNKIPFFGSLLFGNSRKATSSVETIIFIKATIVKNNESSKISDRDAEVYENFASVTSGD
jgi:general secretion pathway protein D